MKQYVYVSDAKLDMFQAQMPKRMLKKAAASVKVDLKVVSVTLQANPSRENRFATADVVSAYIRKHEDCGPVELAREFVFGKMSAKYGCFTHEQFSTVMFSGFTSNTLVILLGSPIHVLGLSVGESTIPTVGSVSPWHYYEILSRFAQDDSLYERDVGMVVNASKQLTGGEHKIDFLARKLDYSPRVHATERLPWPVDDLVSYNILLAAPIYVALAT